MLVGYLDLVASLLHVRIGLHGILFGMLNHGVLGLYDLGHVGEYSAELRESCFDALELIMASPHGAED